MKVVEINVLVLAYLGDTIYEDYVRKFLIKKGFAHVDELQKEAVKYVSAKAQAEFLGNLMKQDFFSQEEVNVIHRARNYKSRSHPKNCDIVTYKHATALEALIGYLELNQNRERIDAIMNFILGEIL